jgi:hypothetical protein
MVDAETSDPSDRDDELGQAVAALAAGRSRDPRKAARLMGSSMRAAGARSVATGRWLADAALDVAAHVRTRDLATLSKHHGGLVGPPLADALIRTASRTTAGFGAVGGAVAAAEEFVPPAWMTIPAELAVEIMAVVAVEMRLVVELHEVYRRPIVGAPAERALAVAQAWSERRGVTPLTLITPGGAAQILGRASRREVTRLLQRRLTRRALRSLWSLAPLLAGAAAAAEANRRATRSLGQAVQTDLQGGWTGAATLR